MDNKIKKYDIVYAILKFDENNTKKARPVLLMENENDYNIFDIYKITTKNNNDKFNYEIKQWKEAGLNQPSYIKLKNIYSIEKYKIARTKLGTLQEIDIKGMEEKLSDIAIYELEIEKQIKSNYTYKIEIPKEVMEIIKQNNPDTEDDTNNPPPPTYKP